MGPKPDGFSLERLDTNGDYCAENCIWATQKQQQNNRTNNRFVRLNGEIVSLGEAANRLGLSKSKLRHRYARGTLGKLGVAIEWIDIPALKGIGNDRIAV